MITCCNWVFFPYLSFTFERAPIPLIRLKSFNRPLHSFYSLCLPWHSLSFSVNTLWHGSKFFSSFHIFFSRYLHPHEHTLDKDKIDLHVIECDKKFHGFNEKSLVNRSKSMANFVKKKRIRKMRENVKKNGFKHNYQCTFQR